MYKNKKYSQLKNISLNCFVAILTIGLFFLPGTSTAETTVPSYCQLSTQTLQQQVSNFEELISLANQYSDDPEGFSSAEAAKQAEFEESTAALMASYDMTPEEYALYMGKHKEAVETYWQENPSLKQQLDDLSTQAMALMTEYESLTKDAPAATAPLPEQE